MTAFLETDMRKFLVTVNGNENVVLAATLQHANQIVAQMMLETRDAELAAGLSGVKHTVCVEEMDDD